MNSSSLSFYRNFYLKTGGFIPVKPLPHTLYPGDFFQIKRGEMITLGNIFHNNLIDPEEGVFRYGIKINPNGWHMADGIVKPYYHSDTKNVLEEAEILFNRQRLYFSRRGSYYFSATDPESVKLANWNELQQRLIIKFTQSCYSFRDLYVVTETAAASCWVLAVAAAADAELEVSVESEATEATELIRHPFAKMTRMQDIDFFYREPNRKPCFFKAKKLAVHDERTDIFISDLIAQGTGRNTWASNFFKCDYYYDPLQPQPLLPGVAQASVLDMLQANELNPNTALLYFKWIDATLDDVEKLFLSYGNE